MSGQGNLWRSLAFASVVHTPMFVPVIVLFWEANGLDLGDVFLLQAIYAVAVVFLEVPTGMVADRVGKRTSLLLASSVYVGGLLFYAAGTTFWWFLAGELLLAVANAFLSGADAALLYDTLKARGRELEFVRWEGRARSLQQVSFAVSNVLGGLIGAWSLVAVMGLSAIGPAIAFGVAWGFVEINPPPALGSLRAALRGYVGLLGGTLRFVGRHRLVRWFLAFLAVVSASSMWLLWLYQPYMAHTGLPVWAFGFVFAAYNLWAAAASASAGRIQDVLGERGTLVALALLQLAPLPLMATFVHPAACLFVLGHQTVRGVARPFVAQRVLAHTWADKRSTVLSVGAMASRLVFAVTAPLVGWAADALSLPQALWVQAAVLAVLFGLLAVEWPRIGDKYRQIKPDRSAEE